MEQAKAQLNEQAQQKGDGHGGRRFEGVAAIMVREGLLAAVPVE